MLLVLSGQATIGTPALVQCKPSFEKFLTLYVVLVRFELSSGKPLRALQFGTRAHHEQRGHSEDKLLYGRVLGVLGGMRPGSPPIKSRLVESYNIDWRPGGQVQLC